MAKGWSKLRVNKHDEEPEEYIESYSEDINFEDIDFSSLSSVASEIVLANGFIEDNKSAAVSLKDDQYLFYKVDMATKQEVCTQITKDEAFQIINEYQLGKTTAGEAEFENYSPASPVQTAENIAVNTSGQEIQVYQPIDFNKIMLERYGVTEKDCYTVHPEQDVLEEIFRRISSVEISFSSMTLEQLSEMEKRGDCVLYANTDEQQSDVDLRVVNLDSGIDVSVPLTETEINQAREKVSELEKFLEAGIEDIDKKEAPVSKKENFVKE